MNQIHEMEEAIAALAMFLTTCDARNPNTERVAAAVEPIAVWYDEYTTWKKNVTPRMRSGSS